VNLLLLEDDDFIGADRARLTGRRLKHLHEVHRAAAGDRLRVGRLGGQMGEGRLLALDDEHAELQVALTQAPPAKLPLTLVLALPRPLPPWACRAWCWSTATGWKRASGRPPSSNPKPSASN
jgi:16S rRNA U1498 N3-methylase RsmE